jgi:GNAT superfamily N-acetyltransferase
LARKQPSCSFLVDAGNQCVLLEGEAEVYDPRSVPGIARALMEGPGFYLNLAGYAFKNAAFIGGYLRDLARIPGEWWPQNRALLRLRVSRAWSLPSVSSPPAGPAPVPGVPVGVRRTLARIPVAYVCTLVDGVPLMAPALWAVDGSVSVVIGVAEQMAVEPVLPEGVRLRQVHEPGDFARIAALESEVWNDDFTWIAQDLQERVQAAPHEIVVLVAEGDGRVISAAWLVFRPGTDFAGFGGGSTVREWRGRGIYRALVARRAQLASARGVRYLQVDASDDSKPILLKLGFQAVTTTTPYVWTPSTTV